MLTVDGLTCGYPRRAVLKDVTLHVERGELVAIVGPNGCGKTTLLRAITGGIAPDTGTMSLDDEDVASMTAAAIARRVAVVAQAAALPEGFSAFDAVMMGRTPHLRLLQSESSRDASAVRAAMERAGCWDLRARRVDELSGGERQRVLIARALAQEPHLLLLDEPTSHLDVAHQVQTFELVLDLCRTRGLSALAVVHDLTLASLFADRIVMVHEGRVVVAGTPGDVLREDTIEHVYGTPVRVMQDPRTGRPLVLPDAGAAVSGGGRVHSPHTAEVTR